MTNFSLVVVTVPTRVSHGTRISNEEESEGKRNTPIPHSNPPIRDLPMKFLGDLANLDGLMIMIASYGKFITDWLTSREQANAQWSSTHIPPSPDESWRSRSLPYSRCLIWSPMTTHRPTKPSGELQIFHDDSRNHRCLVLFSLSSYSSKVSPGLEFWTRAKEHPLLQIIEVVCGILQC